MADLEAIANNCSIKNLVLIDRKTKSNGLDNGWDLVIVMQFSNELT